jgi:uncharacterized membrane protein (Fun14 family)
MHGENVPATERVGNAFSDFKSRMRVDTVLAKISSSKEYLIEIALFSGIGFVTGYLVKKFSAFAIVIILTLAFLALMQYCNFVEIIVNWRKIQDLIGIDPSLLANDNFLTMAWVWFKTHLILGISFIVAFLLGIRCA